MRHLLTTALLTVICVAGLSACQSAHHSAPSVPMEVIVPSRAASADIIDAYAALHRLGLRVALTKQFGISSLSLPGVVLAPRAGTRVRRGSTVTIAPGAVTLGSPVYPTSQPIHRVPNFDGQLLSVAITWTNQRGLFWSVPALPSLPASTEPHLFDAYRIVGQTPRPGRTILPGVTTGRGFRVTPLILKVVLA